MDTVIKTGETINSKESHILKRMEPSRKTSISKIGSITNIPSYRKKVGLNSSNKPIILGPNIILPSGEKSKLSNFNDKNVPPIIIPYNKEFQHDKFWVENPSVLFQTFDMSSTAEMTDAERLNAMTRIIIIIAAIMFVIKFPGWWMFLTLGIIIVIILWYIIKGREQIYIDKILRHTEYLRRPRRTIIKPITNNVRSNNDIPLRLISRT